MYKSFSLFFISVFCAGVVLGQSVLDNKHLANATKSLDEQRDCDGALKHLRLVSDAGKAAPDYMLVMGKASDCIANRNQAIFYYSKFMEVHPDNDSVKLRLAQLRDDSAKGKVTAQEAKAKALYKANKSGKNLLAVYDNDFTWGFCFDAYTGGKDAPYKSSVDLFNIYERPFAKKRMTFQFYTSIGYAMGGNKNWFGATLDAPPADITKVPATIHVSIEPAIMGLIINKPGLAVGLGPTAGFNVMLMPGVHIETASNVYSNPLLLGLVGGARAGLYLGNHVYIFGSYLRCFKSTYTNDLDRSVTVIPYNGNVIKFGIGLRGFGEPAYQSYY